MSEPGSVENQSTFAEQCQQVASQASVLFWKDVRAELRTKTALSSVGLFSLSSLLLMALATATLKSAETYNRLTDQFRPAWDSPGKMALLWVLLCFAAFSGLSHSFVHEEEGGTAMALRLTMVSGAVYAGKLVYNFVLLLAVALLITPPYMAITGMSSGSPSVLIIVMLSGCMGLAAAATIVAALAARARGTGALYGAIGLPLLVVFLMLLLNAAGTLYVVDAPLVRIVRDVGGLTAYGVLMIAVSALTFSYVWEE